MKKRKHRVVVEITFEQACTAKSAVLQVQYIIDAEIHEAHNVTKYYRGVTKFTCKEFNRVVQGLPKYRRLRKFHRAVLYFLARPNTTVKDTVYQLQCWVKQIKM